MVTSIKSKKWLKYWVYRLLVTMVTNILLKKKIFYLKKNLVIYSPKCLNTAYICMYLIGEINTFYFSYIC
nr:MAG TPA: hypothetical protein [Caudoviricetes sp.]